MYLLYRFISVCAFEHIWKPKQKRKLLVFHFQILFHSLLFIHHIRLIATSGVFLSIWLLLMVWRWVGECMCVVRSGLSSACSRFTIAQNNIRQCNFPFYANMKIDFWSMHAMDYVTNNNYSSSSSSSLHLLSLSIALSLNYLVLSSLILAHSFQTLTQFECLYVYYMVQCTVLYV